MKARYRGLELQSGSPAYPVLEVVSDWMDESKPIPTYIDLLHRLRQAGFCFCETMYGCIACKGRYNMSPRNEFEQNIPLEEPKEVPLTLGVGGPVVGTVKLTKDGAILGEISDEEFAEQLRSDLSGFAIGRDPADRYRSNWPGEHTEG